MLRYYVWLILAIGVCHSAKSADISELLSLVADSKPEEAYGIGRKYEHVLSPHPDYNVLMARLAIEAGYPEEAVFALNRVKRQLMMTSITPELASRSTVVIAGKRSIP